MQVTLISPYEDIPAIGLRSISSYLKQKGINVRMVFLPESESMRLDSDPSKYLYPEPLLEQLKDLCDDSILVGISLMLIHYQRSIQLTNYLKTNLDIPIVWGGIHPTMDPVSCLQHADYVVLGEGEDPMLELVNTINMGKEPANIFNIISRSTSKDLSSMKIRPLIKELDKLPFLDYDLEDHYIYHNNEIQPFTEKLLHYFFKYHNPVPGLKGLPIYSTMATRGCPHHCAFCCNSTYLKLYKGNNLVRRRSVENIVKEIHETISRFPFIEAIQFTDDSFFATSEQNIAKFSKIYKEEIGLPFHCLGSPTTITERKLELLVHSGLSAIQMGIQTGSERIRNLYDRNIPINKSLETAKIINKFSNKIPHPVYDIIVDNPWETIDDIHKTLQLCLKIPKPREFQIFSLIIFPGTALHQKFLQTQYVKDYPGSYGKFFQRFEINYPNILFRLLNTPLPTIILRVHSWKPFLYLGNWRLLKPLIIGSYTFIRKVKRWINPWKQYLYE